MSAASPKTQQEVRHQVETLLGNAVVGARFVARNLEDTQPFGDWIQERWTFQTDQEEPISAKFLRPASGERVPAVLYCHAHGNRFDFGMDELTAGRGSLQGAYGEALRELGVASFCMDMPAFGTRQIPGEFSRAKAHIWRGTTLFGQMLAELSSGLSFLIDHPMIREDQLGVMGFSMGSTHAYWLGALDTRIKASVALCSFADLDHLIETGAHDGHGVYMLVPSQTAQISNGELAGLCAPRALFIGAGMTDWSTPKPAFEAARAQLEEAYIDAPDKLVFHVEPASGHAETAAMRASVLAFLETHLCQA